MFWGSWNWKSWRFELHSRDQVEEAGEMDMDASKVPDLTDTLRIADLLVSPYLSCWQPR
jgi:hypothetical protein